MNIDEISVRICSLMQVMPNISANGISSHLGISERQVERKITALKAQGVIERIGARRNGSWKVNIKDDPS